MRPKLGALAIAILALVGPAVLAGDEEDRQPPLPFPSDPPTVREPDPPEPPAEIPAERVPEVPDWLATRFAPVADPALYDPDAVRRALDWLARHLSPNGLWDGDGYMRRCKENVCGEDGSAGHDVGVTGLALLAFLADGNTHQFGPFSRVVRGAQFGLLLTQDPEGCFGPRDSSRFVYDHAIATLALAEAYGTTGSVLLRPAAQKGVDFIEKCQNPYLAWRYGVRPRDNDTSVSAFMLAALHAAKVAGLRVGDEGFDGMRAWLGKVTEPESGRVGYTSRGIPSEEHEHFQPTPWNREPPRVPTETMTAAGIWCRILLGERPESSEAIAKGTDLCLKWLPDWNAESGTIDLVYWHWGSLAFRQIGGDPWKAWAAAVRSAVLDRQEKTGCQRGSWAPVGRYGATGGRVYSTATLALVLATEKRYAADVPAAPR